MSQQSTGQQMDRRSFLRTSTALGAGLALSPAILGRAGGASSKVEDINVALLGAGAQGMVLMEAARKIPGVRFKAVCDIWEKYNQVLVSRRLARYGQANNTYVDYKEMLDKEKDLDAVLIATPDFWHAEHTVACLKAGLNVYCEKEMSNTLAGARKMVEAARQTKKLLQIGHQRRSNPRYIHCYEKLLKESKICGRMTVVNGQWNRAKKDPQGWPKNAEISQARLENYGFKSMDQFRNWRLYKGLGGGPIVDLGSHQIDVYNWFLEAAPRAVIADGGTDYYDKKLFEWYDTVMAVYEYQTKEGVVRAFYQTVTTNSCQGYFETFLGDQATLMISEASARGAVYREPDAPDWANVVKKGYLKEPATKEQDQPKTQTDVVVDVRETLAPPAYEIPVTMDKPPHQPHLENFFDAIRGKAKLNCPAEVGYECAATVLKVNDAVEAQRRLEFKPEEFKV